MATTTDCHINVIAVMWINKNRPSKHEGRQKARSRWLLKPRAWGLQTKREKWARGEAADWGDHWGRCEWGRTSPSLKSICYFFFWLSAFHLQPFFFFPICNPFHKISLLSVYFQSIFSYFLVFLYPCLFYSLSLLQQSFFSSAFSFCFSDTGGVILAFFSLSIPACGGFHAHTVWKRRIYAFTSLSKSDLGMARQKVMLLLIISRHLECLRKWLGNKLQSTAGTSQGARSHCLNES